MADEQADSHWEREAAKTQARMDARPDGQAGPELDARVAVEVMGWKLVGSEEQQKSGLGQPPGTSMHSSKANRCPPYSTDPTADYEVLVHVRTHWPHGRQDAFGKALQWIWMGHCNGYLSLWSMFYEPGDYSRAALEAVAKTPLEPQPSKG